MTNPWLVSLVNQRKHHKTRDIFLWLVGLETHARLIVPVFFTCPNFVGITQITCPTSSYRKTKYSNWTPLLSIMHPTAPIFPSILRTQTKTLLSFRSFFPTPSFLRFPFPHSILLLINYSTIFSITQHTH